MNSNISQTKHKLLWVDAFTDKKFSGNQCAVIFDADRLSDEEMLQLARELNLSESAFIRKSVNADFGARYFTPAEEIPLAGHPTIATIHALIESGMIKLTGKETHVTLELKAGIIPIEIICSEGSSPLIVMNQKQPAFLSLHNSKEIAELFHLSESDLLESAPIQTVSTGTPQLMVPLKDRAALIKAHLNFDLYLKYKESSDFFSPHLFCLDPNGETFARHFGVPPDTLEDSFTGSATGGMAAYLWHYGLIQSPHFIAKQGDLMGRPGRAKVEVVGPRSQIETVRVMGQAVTVFHGEVEI